MIVKNVQLETDAYTVSGVYFDIDRYMVDMKGSMSIHEYNIHINHAAKEISGDVVRYGSWDSLTKEEIQYVLQKIERAMKVERPYKGYAYVEG